MNSLPASEVISLEDFACRVGIGIRAGQIAFQKAQRGKPWRGEVLPVVALPGNRGGNGGVVWGLAVDRCSPALRAKLEPPVCPLQHPVKAPFNGVIEDWQLEEQSARLRIIQPILLAPKGTAHRAELFSKIAGELQVIRGEGIFVSEGTLRHWMKLFEDGGLAGLLPAQRSDRGKTRVLITREWDAGIDLPEEAKSSIAAGVVKDARSMVANDGTSIREALRLSAAGLFRHCRDAGSRMPVVPLRALCNLNTKWAARHDLETYRLIYLNKKDHKRYQDKAVPRIRRALHSMPMGLLVGDVHYADILVQDGDETVRVRLIAWTDASSLFTWVTPVLLSKGMGVKQEDVAESLAQVAMCPFGGIPQEYYLDNGSEYSAISDAMKRLSNLAKMEFSVTLAKPYSPTSKGDIEGHFNILEGIFKGLPGWIGGDRTNKKSENKGKVVKPYQRGLEQLKADIRDAVAIYNSRPQNLASRLAGLSPKEMLDVKMAESGFAARVPSEDLFDLIFSRKEVRTLRQGCITVKGRQYHGTYLDGSMPGETFEVLMPLRADRGYAFVRRGNEEPARIDMLPIFAHGDREGAKLQGRLEAGVNKAVRDLSRDIDPTVSTFEHQKAAADMSAPIAPAPDEWMRAIDKTALPRSSADLEDEEDARKRRMLEDLFPTSGDQTNREASGGDR